MSERPPLAVKEPATPSKSSSTTTKKNKKKKKKKKRHVRDCRTPIPIPTKTKAKVKAHDAKHDAKTTGEETKISMSPFDEGSTDTYFARHLIIPYFINSQGQIRRPEHLIARWFRIFSFLGPSLQDRRELGFLCRLFRDSLHMPTWTTFPHPEFSTLNKLLNRISLVAVKHPGRAPRVVFIANGVHRVEETGMTYATISCSLTLIGESREETIVEGGFCVEVEDGCAGFENLTLLNSNGDGLCCATGYRKNNGRFYATNVLIDGCSGNGVCVGSPQGGTLTDCCIRNCECGILSYENGVVHVYGEKMEVTGNKCIRRIRGRAYRTYGLLSRDSSSKIILHAPLTKESISHDNFENRNWGGDGIIEEEISIILRNQYYEGI